MDKKQWCLNNLKIGDIIQTAVRPLVLAMGI